MSEGTRPPIRWFLPHDPQAEVKGDRFPEPAWPEGWPVPGLGHDIQMPHGRSLKVTAIDWFPTGEDPGDEPFVYVVLRY